jgi:hypothetical protein
MWGVLSDERTDLTFTMYNIFTFYLLLHECMYIQYIEGLCQSRLSTTDHAVFLVASAYEF